ncbi:MAG TPA: hypothetical protein VHN79_13230 [Lacunisphaera sp.]|nr:hypothetical protein [Lacunisphaera sp.]
MSRPCSSRIFATIVAVSAGLVATTVARAHEKWFVEGEPPPLAARGFFSTFALSAAAVAVVVTLVAAFFWQRRAKRDFVPGPERLGATENGMARFYGWVPVVLGIHFAVPLLVLGVQGRLFSPNNEPAQPWSFFLGTWEIAIALSFLYGGLTRLFAAALGALWVVAGFALGWEIAFENLHYLGAAIFFFCTGRGPYSIDRMIFPALEPSAALARWGMTALRVSIGVGFAFVAFTEKLANPALAETFLSQFQLNFTAALGLPMSDRAFIWCAGTTELLIGLFLAFGIFPRTIIIAAWGIINLTLTIFSWVELVGHLPIYGIMAVLLVWAPSEKTNLLWQRGVQGRKS